MKGERIKIVLKENKVKISDLAESLGESQSNMSSLLSGNDIKTGLLERISTVTGISIGEFYGNAAEAKPGAAAVPGERDEYIALLKERIESLKEQVEELRRDKEELRRDKELLSAAMEGGGKTRPAEKRRTGAEAM